MTSKIAAFFTPHADVSGSDESALAIGYLVFGLLVWEFIPLPFVPTPGAVLSAFGDLWTQAKINEWGGSILTMVEAILATIVIALTMAYLSIVPAFRPIAKFVNGTRAWGLTGLYLYFNLLAPSHHALKVMLLTFGITVFYLRDLLSVVGDIAQERYDHAETLGLSQWKIVYHVVILGTLNDVIESLRVNAAMGWMMLTAVESIEQDEGGIGVQLYYAGKHMDLPVVFALLISLYFLSWAQDAIIGLIKDRIFCPYVRRGRAHS